MEETGTSGGNPPPSQFEIIMQKMKQIKLKTVTLGLKLQAVEKEKNQSYMQTWENNVTLESHDPIAKVPAMLERSKKIWLG